MPAPAEFETLPWFLYHPDPVGTGSVVRRDTPCKVCGKARGYIYVGPVYGREDLDEAICPWCIADGSARKQFGVEFMDRQSIGGGNWDTVPPAVVDSIAWHTPGFAGWQQERWFTHCNDAALFLGPAGRAELESYGADLVRDILQESGVAEADQEFYLSSMDKDRGPVTAYVFRCRHCGRLGGYSDCH